MKAIIAVWIFVTIVILGVIAGGFWLLSKAVTTIEQRGLKNVIERVWEGPK